MKRCLGGITLVLGALAAASSLACGVCVEDKVAATYDHAVVTRALAQRHLVVFAEIDGVADMKVVTGKIAAAAARMRGVDRGTIRTSAAPPAFSFALDPAAQAPDAAIAQLQQRLRSDHIKLALLRVAGPDANFAGK